MAESLKILRRFCSIIPYMFSTNVGLMKGELSLETSMLLALTLRRYEMFLGLLDYRPSGHGELLLTTESWC